MGVTPSLLKDFLTFPENRTIDLCFCLKKACRGTTPSSRTVGRDESVPLSVLSSVIATSHTWPGSTSNMDGVAVTRLPTGRLKAIDISLSVLEAGSLKSTCQKVGSLSWALQENRSQVCPRLLASLLLHGLWLPPSCPCSRGLPPVCLCPDFPLGFPVAQMVNNLPAMQETRVRSLGFKDPLEEGMATHSSILA